MCRYNSDFNVQSVGYNSAQSPTNWESIHIKDPSIRCRLSSRLSIALDDKNPKCEIQDCGLTLENWSCWYKMSLNKSKTPRLCYPHNYDFFRTKAWNMRCSRLISMYVWASGASDAVSFRSTNLIYKYCMSPCKIIHQTDLKCKWYNSDAASLTKIEHYPLSAWRSFFQIKSSKAARNDMKPSPKWYLESLSWCGSSLHKSIWSYRVRCGVERRCWRWFKV